MKKDEGNTIPTIEKSYYLHDQKKHVSFKSPDTGKMQAVVIDERTKIFIPVEASAEEARNRYLEKMRAKLKYK
ncbi:MAG TPA: hypothetical protein VIH57_05745 [Bacteroidales bacterium]